MSDACEHYAKLILDEATGELDRSSEDELLLHVRSCRDCADSRVALRKTLVHARSLYVPEPAQEYWEHFMPRLRERIRTSQQGIRLEDVRAKLQAKRHLPKKTPPWGYLAIFAILALAVVFVLWLLGPTLVSRPSPDDGPTATPTAAPPGSTGAPRSERREFREAPHGGWLATGGAGFESLSDSDSLVKSLSEEDLDLLQDILGEEEAM